MVTTPHVARDRRLVPGSRAFLSDRGPALVICGTRLGVAKARRINKPEHVLVAPLDADPGSMRWPASPGITVLQMGAPKEYLLRLVQALLGDGCELVVTINEGRASIHTRVSE